MQLPAESWVSVPSAFRANAATSPLSLLSKPATYTLLPSGLIAMARGLANPTAVVLAQEVPESFSSAMHPIGEREPSALRANSTIDSSLSLITYTFLPSEVIATSVVPLSPGVLLEQPTPLFVNSMQ